MYICQILIELGVRQLNRTFSYLSNTEIHSCSRVKVVFNKRELFGVVMACDRTTLSQEELSQHYGYRLSFVKHVIDVQSVLSNEQLELVYYLEKNSFAPLISCFKTVLPPINKLSDTSVKYQPKYEVYYEIAQSNMQLTTKQLDCFNYVKMIGTISRKQLLLKYSNGVIKACVEKHTLKVLKNRTLSCVDTYDTKQLLNFSLSEQQNQVFNTILDSDDTQFLLHGVTGSGKTEIYIKLCEQYLKQGKQVLILIPEIVLSLQLYSRFKHYFKDQVALLHSKLSQNEKYDEYENVITNKASIIIGTRSAVFTRLDRLGMIICDEFHDDSFMQTTPPRYQAIDIAKIRTKHHQAKLLLASATPTIEAFAMMKKGLLTYLKLDKKYFDGPKTECHLIDMKLAYRKNNMSILSNELYDAMKKDFEMQKQVILLINRRGYAPTVICQNCQTIKKCIHCDIALTYHQDEQKYCCHYCDYFESINTECHNCHSHSFTYAGIAIQKVEQLCQKLFSDITIIRMDADSTRKKGSVTTILSTFKEQKAQLLIGTQMVAKGLDFDNVSTVGIINADSSLMLPHFMASEKTFQLIVQVAGRGGRRDKESNVYIQTLHPEHYAIALAAKHDYESFYIKEMQFRKLMKYPPYFKLAKIKIAGHHFEQVSKMANKIYSYLQLNLPKQCQISKPIVPFIGHPKYNVNFEIIVKYKLFEQVEENFKSLSNLVDNKFYFQIDNNANEL